MFILCEYEDENTQYICSPLINLIYTLVSIDFFLLMFTSDVRHGVPCSHTGCVYNVHIISISVYQYHVSLCDAKGNKILSPSYSPTNYIAPTS